MVEHTLTAWQWVLLAGCATASLYAVLAAIAMPFFATRYASAEKRTAQSFETVGVSVLKPLCGIEPRLYENLRTFCEQQHTRFQLILGVSSPDDPAISIVHSLQRAFPKHDIELAVDARVHGSNLKISNLINMAGRARYDIIVIADSDIAVDPGYLDAVAAPLRDDSVGVVTCLYVANRVGGFWPQIGALFINEWFAPSVRIAHAAGSRRFGFGATLALRRETLERIGGFHALKNSLADDYWLAEHVRRLGLRTVLSHVVVATDVIEPDFWSLWQRETRWFRTIRSVNPIGFAFLFVTFTTPWLLTGAWLTGNLSTVTADYMHRSAALISAVSVAAGCAARAMLHLRAARRRHTFWQELPFLPLRDTLLALQWLNAAFSSHVVWRGARMPVVAPTTGESGTELATMSAIEMSDGS